MKAIIKFTHNVELQIEEADEMSTLNKAITLSRPRTKCDICGATGVRNIVSNKDKEGNIYINNLCKCGAYSKLGQYRDKSGYFWRVFEKREQKQ
jgi:hypothetical protein